MTASCKGRLLLNHVDFFLLGSSNFLAASHSSNFLLSDSSFRFLAAAAFSASSLRRRSLSEKTGKDKPLFFVFHGGSGSEKHHIATALGAGVVKMNVDTDTQWAYWEGIKNFYQAKEGYLQGQIGNPEGADKPNKNYYDPRKWLREGELTMVKRVQESCADLRNTN